MSVVKYFTAVWVSILIYSVLSAFFGASGFSSYKAISSEKERLAENMEDLRIINQELESSFAAVQHDADTIAVYARELGFGTPNEQFIRIVGLPAAAKKGLSAGQQILPQIPQFVPERTIHLVSVLAGLITLLLLIVLDIRKKQTAEQH